MPSRLSLTATVDLHRVTVRGLDLARSILCVFVTAKLDSLRKTDPSGYLMTTKYINQFPARTENLPILFHIFPELASKRKQNAASLSLTDYAVKTK